MAFRNRLKGFITIESIPLRLFLAEFIGTFLLVAIGDGSVAQSVLSKGASGEFLSINLAWGWAAAMGVWAAGGVSGGHINPAVSFTSSMLGRLPWTYLLLYMTAQYLGAFIGAACVFGIYYDALQHYDPDRSVMGENATAGVLTTFPNPHASALQCFFDQVFGTMLLTLCVSAITDSHNMKTTQGLTPIAVGAVVTAIGMSYGHNCGYAINPARDFGPRCLAAIAGWGSDVFSAYHYFFWIPLVAPHMGALLGACIYLLCVGIHLEATNNETGNSYHVNSGNAKQIADIST